MKDQEIQRLIEKEITRINSGLELIPSENYPSIEVLKALGSPLTYKYSEGYPGKRYYGGNEVIDEIENLAIKRAKKLFNAEHINIQSYSGSPANLEVYFALLDFKDKVLAMDLAHGGHLTHGAPLTFSSRFFKPVQYTLGKDQL